MRHVSSSLWVTMIVWDRGGCKTKPHRAPQGAMIECQPAGQMCSSARQLWVQAAESTPTENKHDLWLVWQIEERWDQRSGSSRLTAFPPITAAVMKQTPSFLPCPSFLCHLWRAFFHSTRRASCCFDFSPLTVYHSPQPRRHQCIFGSSGAVKTPQWKLYFLPVQHQITYSAAGRWTWCRFELLQQNYKNIFSEGRQIELEERVCYS